VLLLKDAFCICVEAGKVGWRSRCRCRDESQLRLCLLVCIGVARQ
jgi:hypothetical protein